MVPFSPFARQRPIRDIEDRSLVNARLQLPLRRGRMRSGQVARSVLTIGAYRYARGLSSGRFGVLRQINVLPPLPLPHDEPAAKQRIQQAGRGARREMRGAGDVRELLMTGLHRLQNADGYGAGVSNHQSGVRSYPQNCWLHHEPSYFSGAMGHLHIVSGWGIPSWLEMVRNDSPFIMRSQMSSAIS